MVELSQSTLPVPIATRMVAARCGTGWLRAPGRFFGASRDPRLRVTPHPLPVSAVVGVTVAGAIVAVVGAWWLRSRTLATFEGGLGSRERAEWAYVLTVWALVILLGIVYSALGLMRLP